MKKWFIMALILCLHGCYAPSYLRFSDTLNRKIQTEVHQGKLYLRVSGLCGHSALGIEKLMVSTDKDIMTIKIALKLRGNGLFDEKIEIPKSISMVYWDDVLIWRR